MKQILYIITLVLLFCNNTLAQSYTEYYFKFYVEDRVELDTITQIISIDNVKGLEVFAYANQQELDEFKQLNYKIEYLQKEISKSITMATSVAEMTNWDRYPTYEVYREMMKKFETNYPTICKLDSIGTTNNGRKLYVLKISDNVEIEESEPEFFYTSTMHGDEATGFVLMLRLADSILTSYASETRILNLVNEIEIFINPNANPDGTYYGGNNTVSSAIRSNGVADLNRDFPDPRTGANSPYQPETQAMMNFAEEHNFIMSANFHGGAEVMNYPWDTWRSSQNPHADTDWYELVCTDYVDTARLVLPSYMSDTYSDGVTEGGDWYVIAGGRQDYMNFWHQCREITIEISGSKLIASESLNNYWNYNKESFLNYINECLFGIRGTVTNHIGDPLNAMIWVENHDNDGDSSMVFTDTDIGDYHRLIEPGTYDITVSSEGYESKTVNNIVVTKGNITWLNFELTSNDDSISLKTNPVNINDTLFYDQINTHNIVISNDSSAASTSYNIAIENEIGNSWLELNKSSGTLLGTENDTVIATINSDLLSAGYYSAIILLTSEDLKIDTIPVNIIINDTVTLKAKPEIIIDTLFYDQIIKHNIIISNYGPASNATYDIAIENEIGNSWLELNKSSGTLLGTDNDTTIVSINADLLIAGYYSANIILTTEDITIDTIPVNIIVKDTISVQIEPEIIIDTLWAGDNKAYEILIKNNGLLSFNYYIQINDEASNNWISLNKSLGNLLITESDTIIANVITTNHGFGELNCDIIIQKGNSSKDTIPVQIFIKDTVAYEVQPESIVDTLDPEISKQYPVVIKNIGNKDLEYTAFLDFPTKSDLWINQNKTTGIIYPENTDTIVLTVNTQNLVIGNYVSVLTIYGNENISIPINIFVNNIQSVKNETIISDFKLYPNPFNNQINIEFIPIGYNQIRLNIFNIFGNYVFAKEISVFNNTVNNIVVNDYVDVSQLTNGIYFIQISTSDFQITKKVIKY